ncbi:MAG: PorP/SprF family type IX secretion system membrane protein [Bacteroidetes bacterium]|nr:PorP/SprF family type IX secretion system membrane protein [Bacteroidota bacterium]
MRKRYLMSLLMICMVHVAKAQDIHFSQFYENAIMRNPALTGIFSGDYKAGVNYRTQWSSISVPFQTVLASAESRIAVNRAVGDYLSFGVTATYDHAGSINFNSTQVYPALNFNKAMADGHRSYLSVGFAGGYVQRSFDLSKATFSTQYTGGNYNPVSASGENISNVSMHYYDLGAGMSFNSSIGEARNVNYYLGVGAYHLAKPKQTFAGDNDMLRLDTKFNGNFGVRINMTEQYALTGHLNYSKQGPYREIIGGALLSWRYATEAVKGFAVYAGAFVRIKDAVIPTIKMDYDIYSVTMSYDINTSSLRTASNGAGGYELSLFVRGAIKRNTIQGAQVQCPRFEQMLDNTGSDF